MIFQPIIILTQNWNPVRSTGYWNQVKSTCDGAKYPVDLNLVQLQLKRPIDASTKHNR